MSGDSKRQGKKTPNFDELMIDNFLVLRKVFTEDELGGRSFTFELHDKSIGRLSTTGRASERRRAGQDLAEIDYILFTRPDVDVMKNDRVELTTKSLRVIAVNEPSNFDHHLEIELEDYQPDFKRRLFVSSNEKETVKGLLGILVDFASKVRERDEVGGILVLDIALASEIKEAESVTADLLLQIFRRLAVSVDEKEEVESRLALEQSLVAKVSEKEQLDVMMSLLFSLASVVAEKDNVSANLVRLARLIAKVNEAELVAGDLSIVTFIRLASELAEKDSVAANLSLLAALVAGSDEKDEVQATLTVFAELIANILEKDSVRADIALALGLAADIKERDNVSANLTIGEILEFISSINEKEEVSALLSRLLSLASDIDEKEQIVSNLRSLFSMAGEVTEKEELSGRLRILVDLLVTIIEKEQVQANLSLLIALIAKVDEREDLTANLSALLSLLADIKEAEAVSGAFGLELSLASLAAEKDQVSGDLSILLDILFAGLISEKDRVSGNATVDFSLASLVDEKESLASRLTMLLSILTKVQEKEQVSSLLSLLFELKSLVDEKEQLLANLTVLIDVLLSASVNEREQVDGLMLVDLILEGLIDEREQTRGELSLLRILAASITESEEVISNLGIELAMEASIDEKELIQSTVTILRKLASQINEKEEIEGLIKLSRSLIVSADEKEEVEANLVLDINLSTLVAEKEQVKSNLALALKIISFVNEAEQIDANLSLVLNLAAQVNEAEQIKTAFDVLVGLISSIKEREQVDGAVSILISLASLVSEREQIEANIRVLMAIVAAINEREEVISNLSIEFSFIASIDDKEKIESSLLVLRGLASKVEERDDVAALVKVSRGLSVKVAEKDELAAALAIGFNLQANINEREQVEALVLLTRALVASIDEKEAVAADLILELENFLLAVGHQQEPYLNMLDWDGEQIGEVGSFLAEGIVYSIEGWIDNGRRILAVASSGDPNLVIFEWDDDEFTVLDSITLDVTVSTIDSWWDNGNREIAASTTDNILRIVSWDGTSLSVLDDLDQTSYAFNMVSWWENGNRIIAAGLLSIPNVAIYSWDGNSLAELDTLDLGVRGWGIDSFERNGDRYILLGTWQIPRLHLLEWDGVDLTIFTQQNNPTMARDIHTWKENNTVYFALAGHTSPQIQIGFWAGTFLFILETRNLSGITDAVTGFREDVTEDQLLFFGHANTPRLTMIRWDGVDITIEDTFVVSGPIRNFHLFKPAALSPVLAAVGLITDFGEYVIEDEFAFPFDWTTRWDGVEEDWFVAGWPTSIGRGALIAESVNVDNVISWDELDIGEEPIDLLMQFRTDLITFNGAQVILRGQDSPKQGYILEFSEDFVDLLARTGDVSFELLDFYEHGLDLGLTNWLRFTLTPLASDEVELKARVWKSIEVEPTDWQLEAVSDAITDTGFIGVGENEFNIVWRYYLAVGFGGISPLYPLFRAMEPVVDEKESITSSLTKFEVADLLAIGNYPPANTFSMLKLEEDGPRLVGSFDAAGLVYSISKTWQENGNTRMAVGQSANPRLMILEWDGAEITQIAGLSTPAVVYAVDTWQHTPQERRGVYGLGGDSDPRIYLFSFDGESFSGIAVKSTGGRVYALDSFWTDEAELNRGYAVAQNNAAGEPKLRIEENTNSTIFTRATATFSGNGRSVHTWLDGNLQMVVVGKTLTPRALIYSYNPETFALTELDTLGITVTPLAIHSWWENGDRLIAASLNGAPNFAILKWDGTNLSQEATIDIPRSTLAGTQIDSWEDEQGNRLIAAIHSSDPYLSIVEWDGEDLSVVGTFDKVEDVTAARYFEGKYIPIQLFSSTVEEAESVSGDLEFTVFIELAANVNEADSVSGNLKVVTTTFETNFSEYPANQQPDDWTVRWVTANQSWLIEEDAGAEGGKVLEQTGTASERRFLSWDVLDEVDTKNLEMLVKLKTTSLSGRQCGVGMRGRGAGGNESGYRVNFNDSNEIEIARYDQGGFVALETAAFSLSVNTWYYMKVKLINADMYVKVWPATDSEPEDWLMEIDNAHRIVGSGWVGVTTLVQSGARNWDLIEVTPIPPTVYYTDFGEYTANQTPEDWTIRWDTGNQSWLIQEDAQAEGGKVLEHTSTQSADRLITWDEIEDAEHVEILAKVRTTNTSGTQNSLGVRISAGGSGYFLQLRNGSHLRLAKYDNFNFNALNSTTFSWSANTWYYLKLAINATRLRGKAWQVGNAEPVDWQVTDLDDNFSSGLVGFLNYEQAGTRDFDLIDVKVYDEED